MKLHGLYAVWILGGTFFGVLSPGIAMSQEKAARPRNALSVWDTGQSSEQRLTADLLGQMSGWKQLSSNETSAFQGDAVISNGRLLAVARKQGRGLELYSLGSGSSIF